MEDDNTFKKAVALSYDSERDEAPRVAAKGSGYVAEKIVELARQHRVPIMQDPELTEYLSALNLNREIPPFLYTVVAEILAFVYRLDARGKNI